MRSAFTRWGVSLAGLAGLVAVLAACAPPPAVPTSAPKAAATAPGGAASTAPATPAAPLKTLKLKLGVASSPMPLLPNSVMWLAQDLGYYQREGLDVELIEFTSTPLVVTALNAGEADIGNIGTTDVLNLVASNKLALKAIHSPDIKQYFLIATRSNVGSVRDLTGKRFGVARVGSVDYSQSLLVLRKLGIDPLAAMEVRVAGAPTQRAAALVAEQVDATTFSYATWTSIRSQPGVKILVDSDAFFAAAPIVAKVNVGTDKTIADKSEQMLRFTRAIIKISRDMAASEQAWVDAVRKRLPDQNTADLSELWKTYRTSWAVNGLMNLDEYQATADYIFTDESTPEFRDLPRIGVDKWTNTRFVDAVLKELGVQPGGDNPGRPIR